MSTLPSASRGALGSANTGHCADASAGHPHAMAAHDSARNAAAKPVGARPSGRVLTRGEGFDSCTSGLRSLFRRRRLPSVIANVQNRHDIVPITLRGKIRVFRPVRQAGRPEVPIAELDDSRAHDASEQNWALAIHGGAGDLAGEALTTGREDAIRTALRDVLAEGARALASGASSLDVVERSVCRLEDSPLFNAGRGAVFNARGEHELEASIMDGSTLGVGAVAVVSGVKNPVSLARLVMERTPHVFLQGEGAMALAREQGIELRGSDYFWTAERWDALQQARRRSLTSPNQELGTVGAVALDRQKNLAAATSTGGMTNKRVGRIGDSPIIGAGTYASNASCAVSGTGHGEYFIRATVARDVAAMIEYQRKDVIAAAETAVAELLGGRGGTGGLIVVDRQGNVACSFNSSLMYRGFVTRSMPPHVAIWPECARDGGGSAEPELI